MFTDSSSVRNANLAINSRLAASDSRAMAIDREYYDVLMHLKEMGEDISEYLN